jgi:hypothetical protein
VREVESPDEDTTMWEVRLECDQHRQPIVDVISIDTIVRAAHLLPIYGQSRLPEQFNHAQALDRFKSFFVNHFSDHHAHELITG